MAKKRVTRKQLLKEPDEFITTTGRLIGWAKENTRTLICGVSLFFGLVLVIAGYGVFKAHQASKAEDALSQALVKYQAASGDNQEIKALSTVRADFDALLNDYSRQPAGRVGRIIYGHYCLAGEAFDDAIKHYQMALAHFENDPSLSNVILNGLGSAHQQKGEYEQAMTYYKKIAAGTNPVLKDAALFNLGQLHEQMGETAERQKVFEQLGTDFPDSFYANLVREKAGG